MVGAAVGEPGRCARSARAATRPAPARASPKWARVGVGQRQLGRGAAQVPVQHRRVGGIADRRLGRPFQQLAAGSGPGTGRAGPRRPPACPGPGRDARRGPTAAAATTSRPGKPTLIAQSSRPMSTPSSSALVATTPSSSPSDSPRSIVAALLGRVAGAVGRDPAAPARARAAAAPGGRSDAPARSPCRDLANTIVRRPRVTSPTSSVAASPSVLARMPSSASSSGGFQTQTSRSAAGEPSCSITGQLAPGQRRAGLARVGDRGRGEQESRLGAVGGRRSAAAGRARSPRASRTRPGRRAPRPRPRSAACAIASAQAECAGRMPTCSMSGLVRIRFAQPRTWRRSPVGRVAVVDRRPRVGRAQRRSAPGPGPAPAPWSGTGTARGSPASRAIASSTGRLKASDLPLAVPVTTIASPVRGRLATSPPGGVYSRSMPAAAAPAPGRGSSAAGIGAYSGVCAPGTLRAVRPAARPSGGGAEREHRAPRARFTARGWAG